MGEKREKKRRKKMSAGFISAKDAESRRKERQEEWDRVRGPDDPTEPPEKKAAEAAADARPLHEKLNSNKMAEQEALINQRAFKNQIEGLNEDEAAYLGVLRQAKYNERRTNETEEKRLFNELRRNQTKLKPELEIKKGKSLIEPARVKKQTSLLKNAIKRKSDTTHQTGHQPTQPKQMALPPSPAQVEKAKRIADGLLGKPKESMSGLGLLVGQYSDSDDNGNSDTSDSDEDSDGIEKSEFCQLRRLYTLHHRKQKHKS